jgi:RHS repeat-associated protein
MFRNATAQRWIALVLLTTFSCTGILPAWAQTPAPAGATTLLPLQPRSTPASPMLPLYVVPGKGKGVGRQPSAGKGHAAAYGRAVTALAAGAAAQGASTAAQVADLRARYAELQRLEQSVEGDFAANEAKIAAAGLPGVVLQRQREARAAFRAASAELKDAMAGLDAPAALGKPDDALAKVRQTLQRLSAPAASHGQGQAWGARSAKPHSVALTERAHERLFPRSVMLASAGSLSGLPLPNVLLTEQPTDADLAADTEADRSAAIQELGSSLENNPVRIYNWVRNNIRYTVGYGAMQGAGGVLQSGRGNDLDTASLLIALYRNAGIPARYVYGTVEVPAARMLSWLGVDNTAAAQAMLTRAGIPNQVVQSGGTAGAFQIEHVWVKARIDLSPSRGARHHAATTWVELDPSFKQSSSAPGIDLRAAVSLNESGVADSVRQGAMCTVDRAQNLNGAQLSADYASYKSRLDAYIAQQSPDLSVADALGATSVTAENHRILFGTLPYRTVAQGAELSSVPDALRWQFRVRVFANAADRASGEPVVQLAGPMAHYAHARVTLSFAPETADDAAVLAAYLPAPHADGSPVTPDEFPDEIPGYLVRLKAELRVDGAVVASGGSFVLGGAIAADAGMFDPNARAWIDSDLETRAGEYQAFVLDAQGISGAALSAVTGQLDAAHPAALGRDGLQGALLQHAALSYFAAIDANGGLFQKAAGAYEQRLPSYGRAIAAVSADMLYGVVGAVRFPGIALNVDRLGVAVAARVGGTAAPAYLREANQRNAAYAPVVLERLFGRATRPVEAGSSVRALAGAARAATPVYAITSNNASAVLPQLGLDAALTADISDSAAAGNRLLVPASDTSFGAWTGRAVLAEDPASGAGSYRLVDDAAARTAVAYPAAGMPWLALPDAAASAGSLADDLSAAKRVGATLAGLLAAQDNGSSVRWSYFAGKDDLGSGLFLARLAGVQAADACGALTGILAADQALDAGLSGAATAQVAPPLIASAPLTSGAAGQAYRYAVAATDPQNRALSYRLLAGAPGMLIDAGGVIGWNLPQAGSYGVTVRVDNGAAYTDQTYTLEVGTAPVPLTVSVAVSPAIAKAGASVAITVAGSGGSGQVTRSLTVDGQAVALDAAGRALITAASSGAHPVVATATDAKGTVSQATLYSVGDASDTTPPTAQIASPADDANVTAPVKVTGTATDAHFAYYKLLLRPAGEGAWREIGSGTQPVSAGELGRFDPTQLANGIYELMLVVADVNGQQSSQVVTVDVNGQLKVGQFALNFLDLEVEASGIPIRVTRTYDTRRRRDDLDFGYGWTVDYQSVQLRKNMTLGLQWDVVAHAADLTLCLVPGAKHKINITLPDGSVERFTAANGQQCALGQVPAVDIHFDPLPGTTSRLEIVSVPFLQVQGGQLYDLDNLEPWNPTDFKLTTPDNYVYFLRDGVGITQVRDPAGNTLTYGQNGIVHSNGMSVAFTRDASGRITSITDPSGKRIVYGYTATGDLAQVTDRAGAQSSFFYNGEHGLVSYTDPAGRLAARYTYDDAGRLVAVTDAAGNSVQTTHDLASNQETVKDRRGNSTTYTYDDAGNIVEIVDALGHRTRYAYDALGNETSVTDALGNTTLKSFHPQSGNQLTEQDPLGNVTTWNYDLASGTLLQSTVDARGSAMSFNYGAKGMLIAEPLGRTASIGNDDAGNLTRVTVGGHSTTFGYDAKGNRTSQTDAGGNVTAFSFDANNLEIGSSWQRKDTPTPTVVSTTLKRDANGRVIEQQDELGNLTKTEYNAGGQVVATVDELGRRTRFDYDARGKLSRTTYDDGTSETLSYDPNGNKISSTDRQGRLTRFDYDALNRLVKTAYPDGTVAAVEYDAVGRVTAEIDAAGQRTSVGYDAAGRVTARTDALGHATQYAYDANGNLVRLTGPDGQRTQYDYDALNRLVKTTTPDGNWFGTAWNPDGTPQSRTDSSGNQKVYAYDQLGRLTQVTETNGATAQVTIYEFDRDGNKTSQQDAEGRVTRWTYDARGRVLSRTLPAGQQETYTYDAAGNVTGHVAFDGAKTVRAYDGDNREVLAVWPDGTRIARAYTASGQLASVSVSATAASGIQAGVTRYAYDAQDRLVRQDNPDGSFLAYGYDAKGAVTERTTPAGTAHYAYDANGHLIGATDYEGLSTRYAYDAAGRVASLVRPNGVTTRYGYDANGRVVQILHQREDGSVVAGVRYTLSATGQRLAAAQFDSDSVVTAGVPASPVRTAEYKYDPVGRLTEERVTARGASLERLTTYAYDKAGNRKQRSTQTAAGIETTSYEYDSNDRLARAVTLTPTASSVTEAYTWDAKGKLLSKSTGGTTTYYAWNDDNRLVEVRQGSSADTAQVVASLTYDADGNRIRKIEPAPGNTTALTSYLVDTNFDFAQTVDEVRTLGGTTDSTHYLLGKQLLSQTRAGQGTFYHEDGQGSVLATTDAAGRTTSRSSYDAFGVRADAAAASAYGYTGEYFDQQLGLQYTRARWYDPALGRFISSDPAEGELDTPASLHRFAYGENDPVNKRDPSGATTLNELSAAESAESTLGNVAQYTFKQETKKLLLGDPKKGDFGLIGEWIIQEMLGAVTDMRVEVGSRNVANSKKGSIAHRILSERIRLLNDWLKKVPFARDVRVEAEVSLGSSGQESFKKGALRLDVVVYVRDRAFLAMDMKVGAKRQGNRISAEKWKEYERRFGAVLVTIGIKI